MSYTTAQLNNWVAINAPKMAKRLAAYRPLDEDAFQDSYLALFELSKTCDEVLSFEQVFAATYKKLSNKNLSEIFRMCHPDDFFFALLVADEEAEVQKPRVSESLFKQMQSFIKHSFTRAEVSALEMTLKGYSYRDVSDCLGMGTAAIKSAIKRIKQQTRRRFEGAYKAAI